MRVTKGPQRTRTVRLQAEELHLELVGDHANPVFRQYRLEIYDGYANRVVIELDGLQVSDILRDANAEGAPILVHPNEVLPPLAGLPSLEPSAN